MREGNAKWRKVSENERNQREGEEKNESVRIRTEKKRKIKHNQEIISNSVRINDIKTLL